ncbi:MAG: biotin--[acetyl-CoA-carboxylase] ligase [Chitinophagaceae bacterium]
MLPPLNIIGHAFIELQTVDSTNNYATALLHEGMAQHGTVVFAHHQTHGRGQRTREWKTPHGAGISLSIIVQPVALSISDLFLLSMATAVAAHRFFARYAGSDTKVKWPNDLYWGDRKAGGILIENSIAGSKWKHAIVGIGININQTEFEPALLSAVSLKQITKQHGEVLMLAKELCVDVQLAYEEMWQNAQGIVDDYHKILYKLNEVATLKKGSKVFSTRIKGVTREGKLIGGNGVEELFSVGEVEWKIN